MSALGHRIRQENIRCRNIPEILCPRSAEKDHAMEYLYSLSERQRGNYWKLEDKRLLIDTIVVRKLGLPKVVLSWDVATNHQFIEDGGHRLHTIREQMNNEFPVKIGEDWVFFGDEHRDLTKKERESLRMEGSVRKLTETERDTLRDFELNGDVYENQEKEELTELFLRVNRGGKMSVMDLVYAHKCTNPMVEFVYDIGSYLSEDEMSFLVSKKQLGEGPSASKVGRDIAVYLLAVCGAALEGNAFATKKWPVLQGVCEEFGEETPFTLEHKNICLGFLRFLINIFRDPEVQASRLTSKNRRDVEIVGLITLSKELEGQSMGVEGGGEFYPTSDVLRAMWVKVLKNRGDNDAWWKSRQPAGTKVNLVASQYKSIYPRVVRMYRELE